MMNSIGLTPANKRTLLFKRLKAPSIIAGFLSLSFLVTVLAIDRDAVECARQDWLGALKNQDPDSGRYSKQFQNAMQAYISEHWSEYKHTIMNGAYQERLRAIKELNYYQTIENIAFLLECLRTESDFVVKQELLSSLASSCTCFEDNASLTICEFCRPTVDAALIDLYKQEQNKTLRLSYYNLIGLLGDLKYEDFFMANLTPDDEEIFWRTLSALKRMKSLKAVKPLLAILHELCEDYSPTSESQGAGLHARTAEDRGLPTVRETIIAVGEPAVPELLDYVTDSNIEFTYHIALMLGELGRAEAIPGLMAAVVKAESGIDRRIAARLLGELGATEAIPVLKQALQDAYQDPRSDVARRYRYEVRVAARIALERLGVKCQQAGESWVCSP